jgi:hypothetical protein
VSKQAMFAAIAFCFFSQLLGARELKAETAQADVEVCAINASESADRFTCLVAIRNHNDDDAAGTELRILLSLGVSVLKVRALTSTSPVGDFCLPTKWEPSSLLCTASAPGFVACSFGDVLNRDMRRVRVETTLPLGGVAKNCAALAWSRTPDPDHGNNHAEHQIE